jgi:hypothetical protein
MSNIFSDSFEKYSIPSQNYDAVNGSPTISTAQVRTGTKALSCVSGNQYVTKNFTSRATYIVGFAIYVTANATESGCFGLNDAGTNQMGITIDSAGTLRVKRAVSIGGLSAGGVTLGSGSSLMSFGAWHYLELKVTISSSVGTVDLQLDGLNILSLTGQNTQGSANATANQVLLGSCTNTSPSYFFDDYYINDNAGSAPCNGFLGDTSVICKFPSGNGTLNNYTAVFASFLNNHGYVVGETFKDSNNNVQRCTIAGTSAGAGTPTWATTGGSTTTSGGATFVVVGSGSNPGAQNWMAVNETPNDDNSSYVTDATPGNIDRYTFPAIAGSQVFGVNVCFRAEKDDSGTRTERAAVKSGGTVSDNGSDFALTLNSYVNFQGIFPTDPNTGVAWTVSGVNAAEFGIKTTA